MGLQLSDAQLDAIASTLLICQDPAATKLPRPTTSTGALSLSPKLDSIGADPRWAHLGIGVVDLTTFGSPKIWMHNPEDPWRIASTAKLALLLAAVQLRDDVRWLFQQGFIASAKDGDDLFKMPELWRRSKNPATARLGQTTRPPRISTIFNFPAGAPPEFLGLDMTVLANHDAVVTKLVNAFGIPISQQDGLDLIWRFATRFDFYERLWLAGARSDNIAATSCISEIGLAYLKAVQIAYGLFDIGAGMRMWLADGYTPIDRTIDVDRRQRGVKYRSLDPAEVETTVVFDAMKNARGQFANVASSEVGNVTALIAYMIAWRQQTFVSAGHGFAVGSEACNIITSCIADGTPNTTISFIAKGLLMQQIDKQSTKLGLLGKRDNEAAYLNCEFAYIQAKPDSGAPLNYGVVVTGIRPGNTGLPAWKLTEDLGEAIFKALGS